MKKIISSRTIIKETKKLYRNLSVVASLLLIWVAIVDALTDLRKRQTK